METCFCSSFLLFFGRKPWRQQASFFPLLSTLPLWNSRMVTWKRKCHLGLFRVVIGCKLIYWLTVSTLFTTIYPFWGWYVVVASGASSAWRFDRQAGLPVICGGVPIKGGSRAASFFCYVFFSVFFSMEPIRGEISKQIAAARSVSGAALRFDPVKLAWNNRLEPLRARNPPTLRGCAPLCFHCCLTLSAAGPFVPYLLVCSPLFPQFVDSRHRKRVKFFPAVSSSWGRPVWMEASTVQNPSWEV